jgi:hypothetical protein
MPKALGSAHFANGITNIDRRNCHKFALAIAHKNIAIAQPVRVLGERLVSFGNRSKSTKEKSL